MKLHFKIIGIIGLLILTNCSKEETLVLNETTNLSPSNSKFFYQEFNIDTTNNESDTIIYNIGHDFNLDFKLVRIINITNQYISYSGSIKAITDSVKFTYLETSPNMRFLKLGDSIFELGTYTWYNEIDYSGSTPYISINHNWSNDVFTDYFGFELTRNGLNYYGWFELKHLHIKRIGFNKSSNSPIVVGQAY